MSPQQYGPPYAEEHKPPPQDQRNPDTSHKTKGAPIRGPPDAPPLRERIVACADFTPAERDLILTALASEANDDNPVFLDLETVKALVGGTSTSTIYADATFPLPVMLSHRRVRWLKHEVVAWMRAKIGERDAGGRAAPQGTERAAGAAPCQAAAWFAPQRHRDSLVITNKRRPQRSGRGAFHTDR